MDAKEIIAFIQNVEKETPVKVYLKGKESVTFLDYKVFGVDSRVIFGGWRAIELVLKENVKSIEDMIVENGYRNSAVPLLGKKYISVRIEPRTVIRDQMEISNNAVIMMGAVINISTITGEGTIVDMGIVLSDRAIVGKHYHIGAGAILVGVIEPTSATPVIVKDGVSIGVDAVVIEGAYTGENTVVAADAVVIEDVPVDSVVAGCLVRIIKGEGVEATEKTELVDALRSLWNLNEKSGSKYNPFSSAVRSIRSISPRIDSTA